MTNKKLERVRQYLSKATFSHNADRAVTQDLLNQIERELAKGERFQIVGYARKKDLEPLLDEDQPDGSYITIGLDHPTCWVEDEPYAHLTPLYRANPVVVESLFDKGWRLAKEGHGISNLYGNCAKDSEMPEVQRGMEAYWNSLKPVEVKAPGVTEQTDKPICNRCRGRGTVWTGIEESPFTICDDCDGLGTK